MKLTNNRREITSKQTTEVGICIYCGSTDELTDEHPTPFGLSGRTVLLNASCKDCARITGGFESTLLRSQWFAARAALKTKTRRSKERREPQPMMVETGGEVKTIQIPLDEQWKVIRLPIFPLPAHIDNRLYTSGIQSTSMDQFELSEKGEDIARKHNVDRVLLPDYEPEVFARMIAKIAYGYAVERYTLQAFEDVYVSPAILGQTNDIGRWVGCSDRREFPKRDCVVSVGFKIIQGNELIVKIKMFAQFDGAEYVVIVGRIKQVYLDYVNSLGYKS